MPFTQLVPTSSPSWIRDDMFLPKNTRPAIGGNLALTQNAGYSKNNWAGNIAPFMRRNGSGGGSFNALWTVHDSQPCFITTPAAFHCSYFFGEGLLIDLALEQMNIEVGGMFKVWIDEFFVAFDTPITLTTDDKPVVYTPVDGATDPVLLGVAGNQYGIRADGAGGFEYFSAINGVQTEAVAITWPEADLSKWVRVRVEHFSANTARSAQVRISLNDTVVATRLWSAGLLPDYNEVGINANHFRRLFISHVGSTDMFFCQYRCRAGNFDANGTEV